MDDETFGDAPGKADDGSGAMMMVGAAAGAKDINDNLPEFFNTKGTSGDQEFSRCVHVCVVCWCSRMGLEQSIHQSALPRAGGGDKRSWKYSSYAYGHHIVSNTPPALTVVLKCMENRSDIRKRGCDFERASGRSGRCLLGLCAACRRNCLRLAAPPTSLCRTMAREWQAILGDRLVAGPGGT